MLDIGGEPTLVGGQAQSAAQRQKAHIAVQIGRERLDAGARAGLEALLEVELDQAGPCRLQS